MAVAVRLSRRGEDSRGGAPVGPVRSLRSSPLAATVERLGSQSLCGYFILWLPLSPGSWPPSARARTSRRGDVAGVGIEL